MSDKQKIIESLNNIDDTATFEEILYQLYFQYKIEKGLQDVENGNYRPTEDVLREIDTW